ncbi:44977_t:CDS:2 [Gigaspora margarita]|uniref:44977_t:CDS:1 n=1 Tax=Gigaspora margarita TaxID=4874 RepID=A0ABN7UB11_GIGMA|nr:44977_t:CDS:2 [Gigaspora margarita]
MNYHPKLIIKVNKKRLEKLKCYTEVQAKLRAKKQKQLDDEDIIEKHIFAACHHYHPAKVSLARTDMKQHINKYYCLAVTIENYNFSKRSKMKLIPSVYLLIDPNNSNTMFHFGQLTIFIRPEYFIGKSLLTHIADLLSLVNEQYFVSVLLKENNVRLIWVLFVNRGPNKNPKHFKNIIEYCNLFQALDLDYLTVCIHVLYQSAYNPVERIMASLAEKLAGITLPIDEYGMHLDSQKNVVDEELAQHNFEFLGNRLYELWTPDAVLLLNQNDEFLPPFAKGMNGHYIDLIHALQYFDDSII